MTPRTREALRRMALQAASPHEAEIARAKLEAAGAGGGGTPPSFDDHRGVPDPWDWRSWRRPSTPEAARFRAAFTTSSRSGVWTVGNIRVEIHVGS